MSVSNHSSTCSSSHSSGIPPSIAPSLAGTQPDPPPPPSLPHYEPIADHHHPSVLHHHQQQQQKPNPPEDSLSTRTIICRLFRILVILLFFAIIFYYFFSEAQRLSAASTAQLDVDLHSLSPAEMDREMAKRRLFVKEMARGAWSAYVRSAWGQDALEPVTSTAYQQWLGPNGGFSLIQSMSTLWAMDMPEEFARGRDWIAANFNFSAIDRDVNVFLAVTEVMGSLLSCYAVTGDSLFLEKADEIGNSLGPAYLQTFTGLPMKKVNPARQSTTGREVFLGEVGGQHLEYRYLHYLTRTREYCERIRKIRKHLASLDKPNSGLYMSQLDIYTGTWRNEVSTLFNPASTFYSYLIKSYFQSGGGDHESLVMYQAAIQAVNRNFMFNTSIASLQYARDYYGQGQGYSGYGDFMIHDGCYMGAMFALGASALNQRVPRDQGEPLERKAINEARMHWELAENLTETCRFSCFSRTGLPPNYLFVNNPEEIQKSIFNEYHLSPELAESYLILWRLTKDLRYRDYAWQLAQAIHAHTRTESGGYSNIENVEAIPTAKTNYQPPHFIGATLKYLYLIFSDDSVFPLDKWVFNRVGQPLPVVGGECL